MSALRGASLRLAKAPGGGGEEEAERAAGEAAEALGNLFKPEAGEREHEGGHEGHEGHEGHGHGGGHAHGGGGHGGHGGGAGGHGGGEHGGGGHKEPKEPKQKPSGGGDDRARDEHGRFASKMARRVARMRDRLGKSFEGAWGAPMPTFDRQADEEGDFEIGRADKALTGPGGVAEPEDPEENAQRDATSGIDRGNDLQEMIDDWNETQWSLGGEVSPDTTEDGGIDEDLPGDADDANAIAGPGDEDEFSPFDVPYQTELRARARRARKALENSGAEVPGTLQANPPGNVVGAGCPRCGGPMRERPELDAQRCDRCGYTGEVTKDASGAAEENAGGEYDETYPWGEPNPFANMEDDYYTARANDLPDAALCIVRDDAGRILCVSRPEPPHELAIPGGIVDPGETPAQAASRELEEECGITVSGYTTEGPAAVLTSPTDGRRVYVFVASGFAGTPVAAEPQTEIGWLTPQQLLAQSQLYRASVRELMASGLLTKAVRKDVFGLMRAIASCLPRICKGDAPGPQVLFQGIPVVVDRPRGYVQRGTAPDGTEWERHYLYDYGYVPGTQGGDGEGLDVYLGPQADSPIAVWIYQIDPAGAFDEYKVMLGFGDLEAGVAAYLEHTPAEFLGAAWEADVGAIKALLGQDPGEVIQASKTEATMATCAKCGTAAMAKDQAYCHKCGAPMGGGVTKDAMPDGPGGQPNGDEDGPAGGNGADIVSIAQERLNSICDSIEAAGDVLTPELRGEVASVVALLEAVAPDMDDDMDDEDTGVAPMGPGQPMPMIAREKAAKKGALKKRLAYRVRKVRMSPEGFIAHCYGLLSKVIATPPKLAERRKRRVAALTKALTYGTEVFSSETNFQNYGTDVPEIPMYEEAMVEVHPGDEKVPGPEAVKSGWQYDAAGYTPNENSQQAYDAGSPQFVEKAGQQLNELRDRLAKLAGPSSIAAGEGGGGVDKAGNSNVELSAWTTAYINELPDSAFLYVEGGGKKDSDGRTTPRDLRHFPYKDQDGKVDLPHLRDALSRIPQSGVPEGKKKELEGHARSLLDQHTDAEKSAVTKAERGDDGWPDDMADPEFLAGHKPTKRIYFGLDGLKSKVEIAGGEQAAE